MVSGGTGGATSDDAREALTARRPMTPRGFVELGGTYFRRSSIDVVSEPHGDGRVVLTVQGGVWRIPGMTMAQVLNAIEMSE